MTAIQTVWGPVSLGPYITDYLHTNFNMGDADNSLAQILGLPKDGTIDTLRIQVVAITGNPPAYNVGVVTLDATGYPTTTAYGGSAIESYDFTATGIISVTLNTPATAAAGDIVAIRVWPGVSAPDASNYVRFYSTTVCGDKPARVANYTSAWGNSIGYGEFAAAEYSDGYIAGILSTSVATAGYDSADSPDEYGAKFSLPFTAKCNGAKIGAAYINASTSFIVCLYDDADSLIASKTVSDEDEIFQTTGNFEVYFDEVTIYAGRSYRLTVQETHASSLFYLSMLTFADAASSYFLPEGIRWQKTARTNSGAWTDTSLSIPYMGLLLTDIAFQRASGFAG